MPNARAIHTITHRTGQHHAGHNPNEAIMRSSIPFSRPANRSVSLSLPEDLLLVLDAARVVLGAPSRSELVANLLMHSLIDLMPEDEIDALAWAAARAEAEGKAA